MVVSQTHKSELRQSMIELHAQAFLRDGLIYNILEVDG